MAIEHLNQTLVEALFDIYSSPGKVTGRNRANPDDGLLNRVHDKLYHSRIALGFMYEAMPMWRTPPSSPYEAVNTADTFARDLLHSLSCQSMPLSQYFIIDAFPDSIQLAHALLSLHDPDDAYHT